MMARLYPYHFHKFGSNRKTTISQKCEIAIKKNKISPNPRHINTWLPVGVGADAHNPHICRTIQKECPTNTPPVFSKFTEQPRKDCPDFSWNHAHTPIGVQPYSFAHNYHRPFKGNSHTIPPFQWQNIQNISQKSPQIMFGVSELFEDSPLEEYIKLPMVGQCKPFVSKRTNPHNSINNIVD